MRLGHGRQLPDFCEPICCAASGKVRSAFHPSPAPVVEPFVPPDARAKLQAEAPRGKEPRPYQVCSTETAERSSYYSRHENNTQKLDIAARSWMTIPVKKGQNALRVQWFAANLERIIFKTEILELLPSLFAKVPRSFENLDGQISEKNYE
jgi:hypothetical protein